MLKDTPIDQDIVVKLPRQKKSTKKLGSILASVVTIIALVLMSMYWIMFTGTSIGDGVHTITTTKWHNETRDPEKESVDFSLKEKGLKYCIIVDKDVNHPRFLPSAEYVDLGRNARSYHICLMPGQGVDKATLIVSRKR